MKGEINQYTEFVIHDDKPRTPRFDPESNTFYISIDEACLLYGLLKRELIRIALVTPDGLLRHSPIKEINDDKES